MSTILKYVSIIKWLIKPTDAEDNIFWSQTMVFDALVLCVAKPCGIYYVG